MQTPDSNAKRTLLKLKALEPSQLPPHPVLAPAQDASTNTHLSSFVAHLISEASIFTDETIPGTFKRTKITKLPAKEGGDVEVLAGGSAVDDANGNEGRGEYWFARRSTHVLPTGGAVQQGQATYEEFIDGLVLDHSVKEGEYTPDIFDARKLLGWESELVDVRVPGWEQLSLEIYEMAHDVGTLLNHRVFCTLVLTARDTPSSFLVAQVPVNLAAVPGAFYGNGRHKTEASATVKEKKKCTVGAYTSVERCKIVKPGSNGGAEGMEGDAVQWVMATASDAKGSLPMAVQKIALPGLIAKDVSYFMNWAASKRAGQQPSVSDDGPPGSS